MERQEHVELGILRSAGLRATPQRLAILRLLLGTQAHPSPETVHRELSSAYLGLSLNTVYQTLRALEKARVLRRVGGEQNLYRYDANAHPHLHLVCRQCGRVDDCNGEMMPLLDDLSRAVSARTAWELRDQDSCFYGYCPHCRESRELSPKDKEGHHESQPGQ
ncbi:MAG: Fur family transcriptional regulator [Bacillota bacterium]